MWASDSYSDLPVFPLLERASRHDMLSFLHSFFSMKAYLPEFRIEKLLLDSAHDAYAVYEYCQRETYHAFIDLNPGHTGTLLIRTISPLTMTVSRSARLAYVCIKMDMRLPNTGRNTGVPKQTGNVAVSVNIPVHTAKYGRTVHIYTKDNPRLFNIPPRDSKAWKKEYGRRTSVERSNKREKEDYKLEDGQAPLYKDVVLPPLRHHDAPTS